MEISFQTKEESNRMQEEEFLKLSPAERFYAFLRLSERMKDFPNKTPIERSKDNFQIIIHSKRDRAMEK
jgi:hypothetical protein